MPEMEKACQACHVQSIFLNMQSSENLYIGLSMICHISMHLLFI